MDSRLLQALFERAGFARCRGRGGDRLIFRLTRREKDYFDNEESARFIVSGRSELYAVDAGRASETFEALPLKEDKAAHEVVREATGHSPARYAASLYEVSKVMSYALVASSRRAGVLLTGCADAQPVALSGLKAGL